MDMNMEGMAMMVPYLHTVGGDYLIFKAWKPTSGGAIAGACVGLFVFAVAERCLAAWLTAVDARWRQRAHELHASLSIRRPPSEASSRPPSTQESQADSVVVKNRGRNLPPPPRTIPPFIMSVDIPRGFAYGFQRLLGFILMLAVMTFHAGYLISVIVGLGVGEIIFGRFAANAQLKQHQH